MKKRVFYFNINYNCDNKCVFCYSHNTIFGDSLKKNLSLKEFKEYVYKYKIGKGDRIILNGGEPLLHREINDYLKYIYLNNLETIIYTNGRNINKLLPIYLESNIRFVVPIHGNQIIHDGITGISGSYSDTINSLKWLKKNGKKVLVDMKIILNNKTIKEEGFLNSLKTWERIDFNNSIHITMMADTLVSQSNGCKTLDKENVSYYTNKLYNVFKNKNKLKIYDTCINSLEILEVKTIEKYNYNIDLHYKDNVLEKKIHLKKNTSYCNKECNLKEFCISEVSEHKVLEIDKDKIYENME